jgi:hypothetical protein
MTVYTGRKFVSSLLSVFFRHGERACTLFRIIPSAPEHTSLCVNACPNRAESNWNRRPEPKCPFEEELGVE